MQKKKTLVGGSNIIFAIIRNNYSGDLLKMSLENVILVCFWRAKCLDSFMLCYHSKHFYNVFRIASSQAIIWSWFENFLLFWHRVINKIIKNWKYATNNRISMKCFIHLYIRNLFPQMFKLYTISQNQTMYSSRWQPKFCHLLCCMR